MADRSLGNVLVIEPYYGGSHQAFLNGIMRNISADYVLMSLPARSWKKRMQLAAPYFAIKVAQLPIDRRWFDVVLCSTFIDVALLRSLLQPLEGFNPNARFCTYFHENQFVYPGRYPDNNIRQFQYLNFTTALSSDYLAFNSRFNRETFLAGCGAYLQRNSEMAMDNIFANLSEKSIVLPPGMDYRVIDDCGRAAHQSEPVIVWNHRWEYDKGPDEFFSVLYALAEKNVAFRLIVLGQSFDDSPPCFTIAQEKLRERIVHFGYARSREQYARLLTRGDIVISTSLHEFFGMAVVEAVRAGCRPLLPKRLAYPELFPDEFFYNEGELERSLLPLLQNPIRLKRSLALKYTSSFSWSCLAPLYQKWLFG